MLLEAPQIVLDLGQRRRAGDLLHDLAELAARRGALEVHVDLRPAVTGGIRERNRGIGSPRVLGAVLRALPEPLHLLARAMHCDRRLRAHGTSFIDVVRPPGLSRTRHADTRVRIQVASAAVRARTGRVVWVSRSRRVVRKASEKVGNGWMTSWRTSSGTRARMARVACWSHSPASGPTA